LSTTETACYSTPEEAGLHVESLSFERIPHQTKLYLEYLRDPLTLRQFYPSAVRFHHELRPAPLKYWRRNRPIARNCAMPSKP